MRSGLPRRATRLFKLALRRAAWTAGEMDEEMSFHLEARTEQLIRQGMSHSDARSEASRRFGVNAREDLIASASRREQRIRMREKIGTVLNGIRFAWRGLIRAPGFAVLAVLCLALGIGANAAIYSVLDALLLRPLPFADPARLVRIWPAGATPPGIYEILRADARSYAGVAGYVDGRKVSITGTSAPQQLTAADVSANLFDVLGVRPEIGRTFAPGENARGRNDFVILSDRIWRDNYGASGSVLGTAITVDGISRTVVGVMPPDFRFPSADVQLWTLAPFEPAAPTYWWGIPLRLLARLAPEATIAQARVEANTMLSRARASFPMRMPDEWGRNVDVVPLQESIVSSARPTLILLVGAAGLVLLLSCVNVATLYVDRASMREHEIAVRAALGAQRSRIVGHLLTESLLVAGAGATTGLLFAKGGVRVLVAMLPAGTPRAEEIAVDGHVFAFTLVLAVLSGLAFGMLPALRAAHLDVQSSLRRDGRSGDSSHRMRATRGLAIGQVALAVVIVTAAGLLLKSFWQLRRVDLGFDTTRVLTADVPLPSFDRDTTARAPAFYDALIERARALPGVTLAAAASALPFGATAYPAAMEVEAHPTPPGGAPALPVRITVTPEYFRALSIPLVRGRAFTEIDRGGALAVGIVDATAARTFWPNQDPLGKRIRYVWLTDWITIVGVVGDVKRDSLNGLSQPSLYVPMRQSFAQPMLIVIRSSGGEDKQSISSGLRAAISEIDPTVPISDLRTLDGFVAESAARTRFTTTLLLIFGLAALLLGAIGIYGLMTATVTRRRREIGVRMALGATSRTMLGMVLGESAGVAAAGVALGIAGAIASGRLLRGLLFGVEAVDVPVLISVAAMLGVIAILAALVPARRAARVDPLSAIRAE